MLRSLFTASSGLRAHQQFLDVVGNNLANVNTTGFKASRLSFSDQFSQTLRAHTLPTGSIGGTNPIQVGNGVKVAATDTIFTQGSLEQTGNSLDLAIQGNGFFVVNDGQQDVYTRVGAFSIDADSRLVDTSTGFRVQRVGVLGEGSPTQPAFQTSGQSDIIVPQTQTLPGRQTTSIEFNGNLDSDAVGPLQEVAVINSPLTEAGVAASAGTLLDNLDQTTSAYGVGDTIFITGTNVTGESVNAQFIAAGGGADTVGGLINAINAAYGAGSPNGATGTLDAQGRITLTANRAGAANLTINLSTSDTIAGGDTSFNNFVTTVIGKSGDQTTTAIEVFDEQGASHTLTFTFEKQGVNSWDLVSAIDPSGTFSGFDDAVQGVTFNEDGSFQAVGGADAREVISTTQPLTTSTGGTASTSSAVGTTLLASLDQAVGLTNGDQLLITGTDVAGNALSSTFNIANVATDDVDGLLAAISTLFNSGAADDSGATATIEGGNIVVRADTPGGAELSLSIATAPGSAGTLTVDEFILAANGTDGDDNIEFEINELAGFGTSQSIQLDLGTVGLFSGLTQFGGFTSASASAQDGFGPGSLVSVNVSSDGTVSGVFSNGQNLSIAQLAVATFTNPQGLDRIADNFFSDNGNSGAAVLAPATTNGAGAIQNSALENSNVDISFEFTQLITAQRGFQVNARTFSTAEQVLEEAVNLVR